MMKGCVDSSRFSPGEWERQGPRSRRKSWGASYGGPPAQALADLPGLLQEVPVVVPGGACDRNRGLRFEMLARRPPRVLLRVAPAIPSPHDGLIDHLHPLRVRRSSGWKREREHLPH